MATLTVKPGQLMRFEAYEHQALAIAARHGGRLERAIRASASEDGRLVEVHVLTFPTHDDFANFRSDPSVGALASLRESVIAETEIVVGVEGPSYAD